MVGEPLIGSWWGLGTLARREVPAETRKKGVLIPGRSGKGPLGRYHPCCGGGVTECGARGNQMYVDIRKAHEDRDTVV